MDRETGIKQFDGTNFSDWRFRMEFLLREKGLSDLVMNPSSAATQASLDYQQREIQCQNILVKHVAPCCIDVLRGKSTAYEMATALSRAYKFTGISTRSMIRKKLYELKYDESEPIQKFFNVFDSLVFEYQMAGGKIEADEHL